MNWEHLKAFLWLRWRIISNRNRRAGTASIVLQTIFMVVSIVSAVVALFGGIAAGYFALPRIAPANFMLVWDAVVLAFLFLWMTELMVELQRSELLSLDKFLHLPVSLSSAFLINYIGSISSIGAMVFLPLMMGLATGLVFSKGPAMLLLFPLIAAFALMVTALTHQFRGWLATLMVNQRRRRTIISVATLVFVLIMQTPNIIGFTSGRWRSRPGTAEVSSEKQKLDEALAKKEITTEEHRRRVRELRAPARAADWQSVQETATVVNQIVPLGWLPYGARSAIEGRAVPALLGTLGLLLIGGGSLRRSYGTTMRLYTGQYNAVPSDTATKPTRTEVPASARSGKYPAAFLEKRFSGLSEYASAVTVASLRAVVRAPEAKLMLLSPVVMLIVFSGMFFNQSNSPPELVRPLIASGGFGFIFLMMVGIVGNQFSFDRSGFRTYVLSPAPRRDILLGKNLALAPFILGFTTLTAAFIQFIYPMRLDHFLAVLIQMVPMYLVYCLIGNILSIIAPMPTAAGSMKPVKPKAATILIHLAFVFLFPLGLAPTLIPLGIEFLLSHFGNVGWLPVYLILSIVEAAVVTLVYSRLLSSEARLLEQREQRILEIVTSKAE